MSYQITRKNFSAKMVINLAINGTSQAVWKRSSNYQHASYAFCKISLHSQIAELFYPGVGCGLVNVMTVNGATAKFFDATVDLPIVHSHHCSTVQFVLVNAPYLELVPYSQILAGADPFAMAVFIKEQAPAITAGQNMGSIKVIVQPVEGGPPIESDELVLASAQNYQSTIPPAAPSNVVAVRLTNPLRAGLTWTDNSNNETGFYIYKILGNGSPNFINGVAAGVTSYTDTSGYAGDIVKYEVKAVKGGLYSAPGVSNQITL